MAIIKYYFNPLNKDEYKELDSEETLYDVLKNEGLENKPLCVSINGKIPEEIDICYHIKDDDQIDIIEFVEGNNQTWATIVQVVSIVAAIALAPVGLSWVALAAGSLISGALLANISKPDDPSVDIGDAASSASSPTNARNQSRKLEPIPIIFGSTRIAPDVMTMPITLSPLEPFMEGTHSIDYRWFLSGSTQYLSFPRQMTRNELKYSCQTFCYGLGDFEISQRSIGSTIIDNNLENENPNFLGGFGYGPLFGYRGLNYNLDDAYSSEDKMPHHFIDAALPLAPIVSTKTTAINNNLQLTNKEFPEALTPVDDFSQKNWCFFEGGKEENVFVFTIEGNLHGNSGGTPISTDTQIELQWKRSSSVDWVRPSPNTYLLSNGTRDHVMTIFVLSLPIGEILLEEGESLQVRIRKYTLDSTDAFGTIVNRLAITTSFFYKNEFQDLYLGNTAGRSRLPMRCEAIYVTNLLGPQGGTENYSALVEAKCYVFRNDQWHWEKTRNPAWWFMYYARGGFFSLESRSNSPANFYPYSPTSYWQNYATHPDNTELIFGCGLTEDEIDIEKIKEWALFCDENNLTIDMIVRDNVSTSEILERIAKRGRASTSYDTGKLSVVIEDKNQTPVTMFGMANIISGSFSATYISRKDIGSIRASYADRDKNFETTEIEVEIPFYGVGKKVVSDIVLEGVTEADLAQREANLLAARQFFQTRNYSWKTDHEGFLARRGDLVYLAHDSTQFGYSGRVINFILDSNGLIVGFKGTSQIDKDVTWVMIRLPNSEMKSFPCHYENGNIYFEEEFQMEDGPYTIRDQKRLQKNTLSRFPNTTADDIIYIADIKETAGKVVRIASVESHEDQTFTYTAVDEDPAMWAFEQGISINPKSIDDSIGVVEVFDSSVFYKGSGIVEILFNASDDCLFMVMNDDTGQPLDLNGRFSTSEKKVILELEEDTPYNLSIVPLRISEKVQSRSLEVKLWQA